ncbi:MAG: G5 domain-containing protein [Culicoidibacterales bacterium]
MNRQGQEPSTKQARLKPTILRASQLTALVMTMAFAAVGFEPAPKGVYIQIDDTVTYQETTKTNVADVLATSDLTVETGSIILPGEQTNVQDGMYITISTPKTITLQIGATTSEIETTALTVEELITEQQIDVNKSKLQTLSPQDYVKEDTTIVFNETEIKEETIQESQPLGVEYKADDSLFEDEEQIVQDGIDQTIAKTFAVTYVNGEETTRSLLNETITTAGQPQIIAQGTKVRPVEPEPVVEPVQAETTSVATAPVAAPVVAPVTTNVGTFEMSGYSIEGSCGTGACYTASGYNIGSSPYYNHPQYGQIRIVAADPSVLPLGSIIDIAGFGRAIVLDTGGYIKGNRLDFLFATDAECFAWGRNNVSVTIVE